jgi:hypothetical protein
VSRAEPSRELLTNLSGAGQRQRTSTNGIGDGKVAEANVRKSPDIGEYFQVDLVSRVEEAHINFGRIQDEPVAPFRRLLELEEDDDPVIRQILLAHQPMHDPDDEIGVKVLVSEITTGPLVSPGSEGLDHRSELPAGVRELIFETMPLCDGFPPDNSAVRQGIEALAKQIARYPRHTSIDVSKPPGAGQEFPQNQRRPALGENLRSQRHGTKLRISTHALKHDRIVAPLQVQSLNFGYSSS